MRVITEEREHWRTDLQQRLHPECFVCRSPHANGLGVRFRANADGSIVGIFDCSQLFQGYQGMLHGGVISAMLDGAMTHCLFAHGRSGVTARLIVRFLHPVAADRPVTIRAWLNDYSPPLYVLESELSQDGEVMTRATAKFMEREEAEPGPQACRNVSSV